MERRQVYSPMQRVFTFCLAAESGVSAIDINNSTCSLQAQTAVPIFKTKYFYNVLAFSLTCQCFLLQIFFSNLRKRIPHNCYFFLSTRELRIQPKSHSDPVRVYTVTPFFDWNLRSNFVGSTANLDSSMRTRSKYNDFLCMFWMLCAVIKFYRPF